MTDKMREIWNSIKETLYVPDNLNKSKLERQLELFLLWVAGQGIGVIEACTGFGKTFIAIIAIKRMNLKAPNNTTIVIVPNTSLKEDWTDEDIGYIKIHNLRNVRVFVVKGYTESLQRYYCNLLVLDECHRYSREDSMYFSKTLELTQYNFVLALSGSLNDEEKLFLAKNNIPIIGEVSQFEAESKGWISDSIVYNFGISLDQESLEQLEKLNEQHNGAFKKFKFNFNLANGCSIGKTRKYKGKTGEQWRLGLAQENNWDGRESHAWSPKNIQRYAGLWHWAMNERQKFLFNHSQKIGLSEQILKKLDKVSIIFCETTDFADRLKGKLGNQAEVYHSNMDTLVFEDSTFQKPIARKLSTGDLFKVYKDGTVRSYEQLKAYYPNRRKLGKSKLKDKVKSDFKAGKFKWLITVHAVDEGFDYDEIELGLVASSKGVKRINIQRSGRVLRAKKDKVAIIINLYFLNSQEEKWLKARQKGTPKSKIKWITSIDEIEDKLNDNEIELVA